MATLGANRYGKSGVRLSRITRFDDRNEFNEWTVNVMLYGDFGASYTEADNSKVLPTDTMKNTVYVVARLSRATTIEDFARELGNYFFDNNVQVSKVSIVVEEKPWLRMIVDGKPDPTTLRMSGPEVSTALAVREKGGDWEITSGVDGLTILKTAHSAFTGYVTDKLTTLKPATDRILGTRATVEWDYAVDNPDYADVRARILSTMLKVFAGHNSMSVQHTLFDMGKAALEAAPEIARIHLSMPNLHHLLASLGTFGLENPNHIFVPIDEPHGTIEATIER
ncbi:Uricase [Candidatus Sulfotelmatomonas gaucii]|uniref:Uricase n=1 Tax=Candidatus Sulfuritelmatomonas gaucii TaxID=2043161 RepID=A0A2N9L7A9_9BACT|nr:Uricase [Candidatus Sulfotelmatomonas gaucii]